MAASPKSKQYIKTNLATKLAKVTAPSEANISITLNNDTPRAAKILKTSGLYIEPRNR